MATRALPDLVARIRIDSSGVDGAMQNLVGSFGRANLALAGLAAGIGILVVGGKSMIDISEKHDAAERGLAQAVDQYNASLKATLPTTAASSAEIAKLSDISSKANDSLTIAQNAATKSQIAYTDAVKKHGVSSEQARIAAMNLQDANIRLKQAQDAAADSSQKLTDAQVVLPGKVAASAISLDQFQRKIDDFIMTNKRYISDQSEVIDGYAKLTRAGLAQTEVQRVMNDAVDLAALKHISLSDAVDLLNAAEHGRMKGLIDLGITTAQYTDAEGNLIAKNHDVGKAMDELDGKLKGGRNTLTDLQQQSNILSNDWQNLSEKGGPVLLKALDLVVQKITDIYNWFDRIGKDDHLWAQISAKLVSMAQWIKQYILDPLGRVESWLQGGRAAPPPQYDATGAVIAKAAGGPVLPGGIYTVGENGPETLVMGRNGGGTVIPGGTTNYNLTLNGSAAVNNPEAVRSMLMRMQLLGAAG